MFSSEIKETIYIAIACMTAALVLGLVAFVLHIRTDLASATNNNISSQQSMTAYNQLNKYQDNLLYGEDVIAAIREFAGSDIILYIDGLQDENDSETAVGISYYLDKKNHIDYPDMTTIDYLENGKSSGMKLPSQTLDSGQGVKRNAAYYSYLVFDEYTESAIKAAKYKDVSKDLSYGEVTAIVMRRVGAGRHDRVEPTVSNPTDAQLKALCGCSNYEGNAERYREIYGTSSCQAHEIYRDILDIQK